MTPATPAHKLNGSKRRNVGLLSGPVKKSPCVNQTRMFAQGDETDGTRERNHKYFAAEGIFHESLS